jgi:hypothetical protein
LGIQAGMFYFDAAYWTELKDRDQAMIHSESKQLHFNGPIPPKVLRNDGTMFLCSMNKKTLAYFTGFYQLGPWLLFLMAVAILLQYLPVLISIIYNCLDDRETFLVLDRGRDFSFHID